MTSTPVDCKETLHQILLLQTINNGLVIYVDENQPIAEGILYFSDPNILTFVNILHNLNHTCVELQQDEYSKKLIWCESLDCLGPGFSE